MVSWSGARGDVQKPSPGSLVTAITTASIASTSAAGRSDTPTGDGPVGGSNKRKRTPAPGSTPTPPPASPAPGSTSGTGGGADAGADYRVAVFGAGGVGKSSIVLRFIKNTFSESYVPTVEDTYTQVITCNQKNVCTLHVIDTTGSHQFPAMQRLSISKGHAFVIVYSVTSRQSLEELGPIILTLKEVKGEQIVEVPIMLVGNKKDESQKREVSIETGQKLAERWGCGFIETSAKTNENITELFQNLLALEKKRQLTLSVANEEAEKSKENKRKTCTII
ncbi:ras family domain-containing protein [Ditylenchus destructor]|uniref:Ras family domain-containing protein n=1 Tax=Ditylenchus destructor TaxID=166010 RepID=A0AAD4N634_9BILA|nr:ras family domain-containing protein [Ditylenchus destructor]